MFRLVALASSVLAAFAMTAAGTPALAQNATFYTVTYVEVCPVLAKVGSAPLKTYRDSSRKDEGAVIFAVIRSIAKSNVFVVLDHWTNRLPLGEHAEGVIVNELKMKFETTLAAPNDSRQHNGLAVAPAKSGKDPIYAVSHV